VFIYLQTGGRLCRLVWCSHSNGFDYFSFYGDGYKGESIITIAIYVYIHVYLQTWDCYLGMVEQDSY
jgi:hypothetical protein